MMRVLTANFSPACMRSSYLHASQSQGQQFYAIRDVNSIVVKCGQPGEEWATCMQPDDKSRM
jgi:hypothetical protein